MVHIDDIKVSMNTDENFINALAKYKAKCKCGHTKIIINRPYAICEYCGRKVYRSKKDEFIDKLEKKIKK